MSNKNDEQKNFGETIIVTTGGVHIRAKSLGQQNYVDIMRRHVVTFGFSIADAGKIFMINVGKRKEANF